MRIIAALLLLLLAVPAYAETIKFAWDKPLTNTDGSPSTVSGYRFYITSVPGGYGAPMASVTAGALTYSFIVPEKMAGATFYATVTAYNEQGESDRSNELRFVTKVKPATATSLRIVP